jgi:hypothetical protein
MFRKPRRRSVAIGAAVAAVVLGGGTVAALEGGLTKCVRWAVDDVHAVASAAGEPPPPQPTPQVPSSRASSSRSTTHVGCGDRNSTPPRRP